MRTTIIEVDGFPMITIRLDPGVAGSMMRAAQAAQELLAQDQVRRDVISDDPSMLPLYDRGAQRLAILGGTTQVRLSIDPSYLVDAHTTTCLLASRQHLKLEEKSDLVLILDLVAAILPVLVNTGPLPPWDDFQSGGKGQRKVRTIYEDLCKRPVNEDGCRIIKMGDALVLREGIQLNPHPAILRLWKDLSLITATHRNALARLGRTKGPLNHA